MTFTSKQLDGFHTAAASLKLFSRAELNDERNRSLVEKLYVDPLPNEQVYKTLLADSTTIIVGRKGTGKSTVFQRVQHEIRKNKMGAISAYMDIRNVYEASQIDPITADKIDEFRTALSPDQVQKFLLYKRFVRALIADIRTELRSQVEQSFLTRLKERMTGSAAEIFAGLDAIIAKIDNPVYESIDGFVSRAKKETAADKVRAKVAVKASAEVSATTARAAAKVAGESEKSAEHGEEDVYTQILMRVIGVNDIIEQLQQVLSALGIRSLYIFLDDFSELPREAMRLLVDALISPLARWSDFIKFKIAAYPGRVYLGSLDKTKIEEINLVP